jgi:hypothetical protein
MIYIFLGEIEDPKIYDRPSFSNRHHLSQLSVPHTQNFEIPLKTQESKNFEISTNFQKMLNGSKCAKRCLLGISIQNFYQIWKILKFS